MAAWVVVMVAAGSDWAGAMAEAGWVVVGLVVVDWAVAGSVVADWEVVMAEVGSVGVAGWAEAGSD